MDAERFVSALHARGVRATPQRVAVWQGLQALAGQHPTAAELHSYLHAAHPTLGLATVYNALDLLAGLGLVRGVRLEGAVRYDVASAPHINLVCTRCGRIDDLPPSAALPLPAWQAAIAAASGYRFTGSHLDLHGLCPTCQEATP